MVAPASGPSMSLRMRRLLVDDGADLFAGERARQFAALEPIDDLHAFDVPRVLPRVEELAIEHQFLGQMVIERFKGGLFNELRVVVFIGIAIVEPIDVFDEDDSFHAQNFGDDEESKVGAVRRQRPAFGRRLPEVIRRNAYYDWKHSALQIKR